MPPEWHETKYKDCIVQLSQLDGYCSIIYSFKEYLLTSGQGGTIGKHSLLPRTIKSKLQPKYRTTISQNCQKLS